MRLKKIADTNDGGGIFGSMKRGWDSFATGVSLSYQRFRIDAAQFGADITTAVTQRDRFIIGQTGRTTGDVRMDRYVRPAAETKPTKAAEEFQKLASTWQAASENVGRTQREIALGAAAANVASGQMTAQLFGQLRALDLILAGQERRAQLEKEIAGYAEGNKTAYDRFEDTLQNIANAMERVNRGEVDSRKRLDARDTLERAQARAFLEAERTLGRGPASYAINGIDPRTLDGARFLADLQVRREVQGVTPDERVRNATEDLRQIQRNALQELQDIGAALRNVGGILPAPNI
jgi:hypothetical protein